jgi:hypothetical protein
MMGTLIGILAIAALIGVVVWNHLNASAAHRGVSFTVPEPLDQVIAAIHASYLGGAKSKVRTMVGGVIVTPADRSSFRTSTKIGDLGEIRVSPVDGGGSRIEASTSELYVGTHPKSHFRSGGLWTLAAALAHGIYKMLGIAPNAAKMKRFQQRIELRVCKHIQRTSGA